MSLMSKAHTPIKKSLNQLSYEDLFKINQYKKYDDPILLNNFTAIDASNYDLNYRGTSYSFDLPANRSGSVFYYNEQSDKSYHFLKGSKVYLEKSYEDKLKIYEVNVDYDKSEELIANNFLVEFHDEEIINILEFTDNQIKFHPEENADAFEILVRFEGEGFIFNMDVSHSVEFRKVKETKELDFNTSKLYNNNEFVTIEDTDAGIRMHVEPNDKAHFYISYDADNNNYKMLNKHPLLDNMDLNGNFLMQPSIKKDDTVQMIPMIIEYSEGEKTNIKRLNVTNEEIISFHKGTDHLRLAFRINGAGSIYLDKLKFSALEALPENTQLALDERNEVIELLSPKMELKDFKVACIMDEFTYTSFEPEVNLYKLDINKWKSEILFIQPDLVFIESAWNGNDGVWAKKIGYYDEEQHKDVRNLVEYAQSLNIPVVFWNKEDPVHYDRFIETAKLCDYVFTTDEGRVPHYIRDCNHGRVGALPFAAQPKYHNPIKIQNKRIESASFAGSYYRHHEERSKDMDVLFEASVDSGLVIFDRNYEKNLKGLMPNHMFPENYQPFIKGTLPFNLIQQAYKGYKFMINVNTVKNSETMFSRRVFEGLISGTPIISNYSLGMVNLFGDIIVATRDENKLRSHLSNLYEDEELYTKYSLTGVRRVLQNHTYEQRMKQLLNAVGYSILSSKDNIFFTCFVNHEDELAEYIDIFRSQNIQNKKLVIIAQGIEDYKAFYNQYNNEDMIGINLKAIKKYRNLKEFLGSGYLAVLDSSHYYGENYALDLILANNYTDAEVIGKRKFYSESVSDKMIIENPDNDYIYTNDLLIDRSLIKIETFDHITVESALEYMNGEKSLQELAPFGVKFFSNDALNFIADGHESESKDKVTI